MLKKQDSLTIWEVNCICRRVKFVYPFWLTIKHNISTFILQKGTFDMKEGVVKLKSELVGNASKVISSSKFYLGFFSTFIFDL